jgi:hypothetical protein
VIRSVLAQAKEIYRGNSVAWRALSIFVLVVALLDFSLRVAVFRDDQARVVDLPKPVETKNRLTPEVVSQRLAVALPAAAGAGQGGAPIEKDLRLLGVFSAKGLIAAVVQLSIPGAAEPPVTRVVRESEDLEGWTVEVIEPRRLRLVRGEQSRELVLFKGKPQ